MENKIKILVIGVMIAAITFRCDNRRKGGIKNGN